MRWTKRGTIPLAAMLLIVSSLLTFSGCGGQPAAEPAATPAPKIALQSTEAGETAAADDLEEEGVEEKPVEYYIGISGNGYAADDENYKLTKVAGYENVYSITVLLTAENADQTYKAHYYKITNGSWAANSCWGLDCYVLEKDKRPVNELCPNGGLGSIYIPVTTGGLYPTTNRELTVYFNSETKAIADSSFYVMNDTLPIVYGNFLEAMGRGLNWSLKNGLPLYDDNFDGVYEGTYTIPAYTGTDVGYTIYACLSQTVSCTKGADPAYKLSPNEQVAFEPFKPEADTEVTFRFDIRTKTGTIATP